MNGLKYQWVSGKVINLSPTLFGIFVNDLAIEIKNLGLGIPCGTTKVSILLYTEDIALLAENEKDLQTMLNKLEWYTKRHLVLNANKSKVVHYRGCQDGCQNL